MGQPNTSNSNAPQNPLHPLLQSALGCLEVQLDDELTRYRRQRSAQPAANRPFKGNIRTKKKHGLDLISVKPSSPNPSPSHQPTQSAAAPSPAGSPYTNGSANGSSQNGHVGNHLSNGHSHNGTQAINGAGGAIATLNPVQSQASREVAIATPSPTAQPNSNIVPFPQTEADGLNSPHSAEPHDYLESSEHLLQSLVEEAQTSEHSSKSRWTNQLFTPLGIGSMLLLLVSSIGLGYVIANPDALSNISSRWQSDDDTSSTDLDTPVTPSASQFDPSGQPNLSSEEFVELDLGTLSTLPSNGSAPNLPSSAPGLAADGSTTPTPLATPVTPSTTAATTNTPTTPSSGASTNSTTPPASSSAAPSSSASRSSAPPAPSSTASQPSSPSGTSSSSASRSAAPAPAASPRPAAPPTEQAAAPNGSSGSGAGSNKPSSSSSDSSETASSSTSSASSSDYYHVVVPYTGDQSLDEARQVAGDAYIHNSSSGATIRLGAFADQSSAQEMVQNLQEQGIEADIED